MRKPNVPQMYLAPHVSLAQVCVGYDLLWLRCLGFIACWSAVRPPELVSAVARPAVA